MTVRGDTSQAQQLSFWHPVGPHVGESLAEILGRKQRDIERHGFTLWSFAPARRERVDAWRDELRRRGQRICFAVCCGDASRDPSTSPGSDSRWLAEYTDNLHEPDWSRLPSGRMTSYHRPETKAGVVASAFFVTRIETPHSEHRVMRPDRWLCIRDLSWTHGRVPTRGEYLVEAPPTSPDGLRVRALLHVADPFVVWVR